MVCDTNDFDSYSRDFKVYCYSTWKQTHVNPINSKQSWAFLWVACRTKCLVWDSSPYFPFAICSTSSNFAAASAYATARKQEPFIAHSKDSMAVNLMWCLLCMHPLLCWGAATEGLRGLWAKVQDAFCKSISSTPSDRISQLVNTPTGFSWSKRRHSYISTLYHFAGQ